MYDRLPSSLCVFGLLLGERHGGWAKGGRTDDSSFDFGVEVAVAIFVGFGLGRPLIPRRFLWILPAKTVCDEA